MSNTTYNLSELIKTDCCIDCGTNEKLREVVGKIAIPANAVQEVMPIENCDTRLMVKKGTYATFSEVFGDNPIPLTRVVLDVSDKLAELNNVSDEDLRPFDLYCRIKDAIMHRPVNGQYTDLVDAVYDAIVYLKKNKDENHSSNN